MNTLFCPTQIHVQIFVYLLKRGIPERGGKNKTRETTVNLLQTETGKFGSVNIYKLTFIFYNWRCVFLTYYSAMGGFYRHWIEFIGSRQPVASAPYSQILFRNYPPENEFGSQSIFPGKNFETKSSLVYFLLTVYYG